MKLSEDVLGQSWDQGKHGTCIAVSAVKCADIMYRFYLEGKDPTCSHKAFHGHYFGPQEIIDYFTMKLDEMEKPGPLKRLDLADVMEYCMHSGFPLLENCKYKGAQLSYDVDGHYCEKRFYPFQLGCQFYRLTRDLRHFSIYSVGGEGVGDEGAYKRDIGTVIHSIRVLVSRGPILMGFAVGNHFRKKLQPSEIYRYQSEFSWKPPEISKWKLLARKANGAKSSFELEERGYTHTVNPNRHIFWSPGNPIERHCMVAYDSDSNGGNGEEHLKLVNSWGSGWGDKGKCRIHLSEDHPFLTAAAPEFHEKLTTPPWD